MKFESPGLVGVERLVVDVGATKRTRFDGARSACRIKIQLGHIMQHANTHAYYANACSRIDTCM